MSFIEYSQVLNLNSLDRVSGNNADFIINIPIDEKQNDYDTVCLLSASIPKSYYLIQNNFNTFILEENMVQVIITITPANYSVSSFMTFLVPILNAFSPNGLIYSMAFNYDKGKFIFQVINPLSLTVSFIYTDFIFELMGFNENSTNLFVFNKLISDNVVDFATEVNLYIRSDMCLTQNNDILASISSALIPNFSYIKYECPDVEALSRPLIKLNNQHSFKLTNDRSNDSPQQQILFLNGINMILNILIYKKSEINSILKQYIKYKVV